MNQWLNRSHPQTLQAGVILGYISAFFGLFSGGLFLPLFIGLGAGAFVTANNKRWGYILLAICASLVALFYILVFINSLGSSIVSMLFSLNRLVFPVALAAAVLHSHSREYQRIWFD